MQVQIKIRNLDKFIKALARSPEKVSRFANTAIRQSIYTIEGQVKPRTPVDTGNLRNTQQSSFGNLIGKYYPTADYGIYVEMGTYKMRAQPYLRPGVEASLPTISKIFEKELNNAMEEIAKESNG